MKRRQEKLLDLKLVSKETFEMPEFPLFPFKLLRPNPTYLNGKLNQIDPWAKRELWRSHPFFSARNRFLNLFPGLGLGTLAFVTYVVADSVL